MLHNCTSIHCLPNISMLKICPRIMPSFLSQSLGASFWDTIVETLEESKGRLLDRPPSPGQALSNQELFDNVLEDARSAMELDPPSPLAYSDDE